jgi:Spy/CpxP family protein refolding chaperone
MKKQMALAGAVVAILVGTIAVANAQRPGGVGPQGRGGAQMGQGMGQHPALGFGRFGGGPGGRDGRPGRPGAAGIMLRGLDLTEDQQTHVKALLESQREANQAGMKAVAEARQALHAAVFGAAGSGSIADLQAKLSAAEQAQLARRVEAQIALAGILTPEQKAKLLERGGRGGRGPGGPGNGRD